MRGIAVDEQFDVVDEDDRVIGVAPRSVVHARRWRHRAVHIFVFKTSGELLVQQRSAAKDEYPLRWTSSASGHLHAGEDYAAAAHRELLEELGLQGHLEFLQKFVASEATSFEHSALYRLVTDTAPRFDAGEIASGGYWPLRAVADWIDRHPDDFTPCFVTLFRWYERQFGAT